jgi:hypothetical protein
LKSPPRARLADGVEMYLKGESQHDGWNGAEWISLILDAQMLRRLLALRAVCAAHGLTMLEFQHAPLSSQYPERPMSSWSIRLNGNCFWLYGVPGTEDDLSISCTVNFQSLLQMLTAPEMTEAKIKGFGAFGGALLVADDDFGIDDLLETLEVDMPGLLARERELQMAATIGKHRASAEPTTATAQALRRRASV